MIISCLAAAFVAAAGTAPAVAPGTAISYDRFVHPKGDYSLKYPAGWKRSYGVEALGLRPAGRAGKVVQVKIEKSTQSVQIVITRAEALPEGAK